MESGTCALLVYVDDLLVMAEHEGDVTAKFDLIRANAESRVFFLEGFSRGYNVVLRGKHGTS